MIKSVKSNQNSENKSDQKENINNKLIKKIKDELDASFPSC